jgi:hypothetical protein
MILVVLSSSSPLPPSESRHELPRLIIVISVIVFIVIIGAHRVVTVSLSLSYRHRSSAASLALEETLVPSWSRFNQTQVSSFLPSYL